MKPGQLKVKAKVKEGANPYYQKGDEVEGYLNSWHMHECYTMIVEMSMDGASVSSGIAVIVVEIDIDTLQLVKPFPLYEQMEMNV